MKNPLKKVLGVVAVLLVVLLVVIIAASVFADSAVKKGIEYGGSQKLGVPVTVGSADLSVFRGSLALGDLTIANPQGYEHKHLLELPQGNVAVDTGSLLSDTVQIKRIRLDGVVVVLEQKDLLKNNIKEVLNSLPPSGSGEPSGKKVHIDLLEITNAKAKVKLLPVPGRVDTLTLDLSKITMEDLGGDKALDAGGVIAKVLVAIAGGVAEKGTGVLPKEMLGSIGTELEKLGALPAALLDGSGKIIGTSIEAGVDAIQKGGDIGEGVMKGVGEVGEGVADGLKGLFGDKKKDE